MTSRPIRLLIAPFHLGRRDEGVGNGPLRLLELGAADSLADAGAAVAIEPVSFDPTGHGGELAALIGSVSAVARQLANAPDDRALPVILAGDCFTSLGVLTGLSDLSMSLVWFDAHGDFNTPESSRSGYVDGMALAAAVGDSQRALLASVPGFRALATDRVLLLGTRDLDPAEEERLAHSPITHLPANRLGDVPLPDLGGGPVHLHLDLDVLHDSVGQVNAFRLPPGGVSPSLLLALVEEIAGCAELRSVAITAYDPSLDCGEVGRSALAVLRLLGKLAVHEPTWKQ